MQKQFGDVTAVKQVDSDKDNRAATFIYGNHDRRAQKAPSSPVGTKQMGYVNADDAPRQQMQ